MPRDRADSPQVAANDLSNDEFDRLYGASARRTPTDVAALLEGFPGTWWISGGWALEAFTGVARDHHDVDPSLLAADLPLLRKHVAGRLDVWAVGTGALRALLPDDRPDEPAESLLWDNEGQIWLRRDALSPWEYDIQLVPGTSREWVYRRDESFRMPLTDALWERAGIRYLQPEIQLLYKAKGLRPKDQLDFDNTLPHLDDRRRTWLRSALTATRPAHPWLDRL